MLLDARMSFLVSLNAALKTIDGCLLWAVDQIR